MSLWKPLRVLYIRTTDLTHGYQGKGLETLRRFYRLWAPFYDATIRLDPAYRRHLREMVESVVRPGDVTLDVGCGTGISTLYAAPVASRVFALDPSGAMLARLRRKLQQRSVRNVTIIEGFFPEALRRGVPGQAVPPERARRGRRSSVRAARAAPRSVPTPR